METRRVQEELMEVVQSLSSERQEQLLHWARSLARPASRPSPAGTGALVEKKGTSSTPDYSKLLQVPQADDADLWGWDWEEPGQALTPRVVDRVET